MKVKKLVFLVIMFIIFISIFEIKGNCEYEPQARTMPSDSIPAITSIDEDFIYTPTPYNIAEEETIKAESTEKVYDYAGLLTESEEEELYNQILEYIQTYNMDMVVVTTNENNKSSSMAYADDFYDYNGFGIGEDNSGLLFLIDMDKRNMWISTTGKAIELYNDVRIDNILDYTYNKIVDEDYFGCASEFIKYSKYFANKGISGIDTIIETQEVIAAVLIVSTVVTIIFICIGRSHHKNVKKQTLATAYITQSLNLNGKRDIFIRKHVSKSAKADSSSGGSSTHSGSSGVSHGGGGRSF